MQPHSLPFAIDNGRYHRVGESPPFDQHAVYEIIDKVLEKQWGSPMFTVAPDVPYSNEHTMAMSLFHLEKMKKHYGFNFPVALAVQNDMLWTPDLNEFDWIFVGGDDEWKDSTIDYWAANSRSNGMRCHVGRVNTQSRLFRCIEAGVDSVDGTGLCRYFDEMRKRLMPLMVQDLLW